MAFFSLFKREPTKILALSITIPGMFLDIFDSVEDYKRYLDYLNEYRIILLELSINDPSYRNVYVVLHHKYPTKMNSHPELIDRFIPSVCETYEMAYGDSGNHKFNSADPALAVTFNQRYSTKVVRKHNKRRHK